MLENNEFAKFAVESIQKLLPPEFVADEKEIENIGKRLAQLFLGSSDKSLTDVSNWLSKEKIRANLEKDEEYQNLKRKLTTYDITLEDFVVGQLGFHDTDELNGSGYEILLRTFYLPRLPIYRYAYYHYRLSLSDFKYDKLKRNLTLETLEFEINAEPVQLPHPTEKPDGTTFNDENEIDDVVAYYTKNTLPSTTDYKSSRRRKASSFDGLSGTEHIVAEDYGLHKDQLIITMVIAYGKRRSIYNDGIVHIITNWMNNDIDSPELDFFLNNMKIYVSPDMSALYNPTLGSYWRKAFIYLMKQLQFGVWYKAEDLWQAYKSSAAPINLGASMIDVRLNILQFTDGTEPDKKEIDARLEELVFRPVFFGMLYIFALFGCLEISEKHPELTMLKSKKKAVPYSSAACLDKVSLTALGNWVLGHTKIKPKAKKEFAEPVADKDLLLITYKGKDIAVRNYLSRIAAPVGDIRFKVTLQTFTKECSYLHDAQKLIDEFKHLICKDPSQNWLNFFDAVRESFNLFSKGEKGITLKINNIDTFKSIMKSINIAKYITRCEGNMIFISEENIQSFNNQLIKLGYHIDLTYHSFYY